MGIPVVIATNGYGQPITIATNGYGLPVEVSTNGYGMPAVLVASGGMPVVGSFGLDVTAPLAVSFSPTDNSTGVNVSTLLIVTFDSIVTLGTGNVTLKRTSDNVTIEAWNVATEAGTGAGQVSVEFSTQLTMRLTTSIAGGTEYYVIWDANVVKDIANNPVAANASTTLWSFTTVAAATATAFRSIANTSYSGSGTSTVVTKPAGLALGDFMLWCQVTAATSAGPDPTFPAGWTQIASAGYPILLNAGSFHMDFRVAYKFADASDVAASNFTATHANCSSQGAIACFSGVHATTPFDVTPTQNLSLTGVADTTANGLTTVTDGCGIVIWGCDFGDTSNNLTAPTGTTPTFTERLDVAPLMHMFEGVLTTAGATGNKTFANNSNTVSPWGAYMIALRPA
jgi:hypothetical protein